MSSKLDVPVALSKPDVDLWLSARLWPNGPTSPLQSVVAICGSPRSGTTWLHNILIESGRFKGIPANDMAAVGPDPFLTDENRYIHLSLMQASLPGSDPHLASLAFKGMCHLIYLRFGVSGQLMLKSPYYSFFADTMYASGLCGKFIYMRRNPDFTAVSMLRHPHIGQLLKNEYERSHDVIAGSVNVEVRHIDQSLVRYVINKYARLSLFDRALFKVLSFSTSFVACTKHVPQDSVFIFNYDTFQDDFTQRAQFRQFLNLNDQQRRVVERSFRCSAQRQPSLPPHDPAFRRTILEAERSLWRAVDTTAAAAL